MLTALSHPEAVFAPRRAPRQGAPSLEFFQPLEQGTGAARIGHDYRAEADQVRLSWPHLSLAEAAELRALFLAAGGMADELTLATLPEPPLQTSDGAGGHEWFSAADGFFFPAEADITGASSEVVRFAEPRLQITETAPGNFAATITLLRCP